ncbi:MAG: 4Fe-4S binding protein [Rhodospirillales bacterium]|nr:4Fe-4S binding protein [Rhodospirillales bacterium]
MPSACAPSSPTEAAGGRSILARLGDWMAAHRRGLAAIQWGMVAFYLVLLVWPALLPLPGDGARILDNLARFAQFVFWGVWWPLVMVSMLLVGRVWCGVFCPEGALTEWISRFGAGRGVPRWLAWPGWPLTAFAATTVYGQLVTVYEYPKATLLVLGGSTVAALAVGLIYGRGRRVWCRHLCPANGVFALLSRLASLSFRVDREAWRRAPRPPAPVICPPLVNIRAMTGNGPCHMCGRCSGHRDAVRLAARRPNRDVLTQIPNDDASWEIGLLTFGLMGLATGAFHWAGSRVFVAVKQALASWLVDHGAAGLLSSDIPWFVLTHYPEAGDVFTWLDGLCILLYIGTAAALIGSAAFVGLELGARSAGAGAGVGRWRLGYALLPVAAAGLVLGLSGLTVAQLRGDGIAVPFLSELRVAVLTGSWAWTGWLAWRLLASAPMVRRLAAWVAVMAGASVHTAAWAGFFFVR